MTSPPLDSRAESPRDGHPLLLAALAYLAVAVLLTWPLVLRPDAFLFGDFGDTRGTAWGIWARAHGFAEGPVNFLLAAPFGVPTSQPFSQPVGEGLLLFLARISDEITALNVFVLLSFAATATATCFLLQRLVRSRMAAFVGGLIFGFCPAVVMQAAGGHVTFAFNVFIPLFILALFHNRSRRSPLSALLVAVTFAGITFTAIYFGYFAIFVAALFVAFDFLTREQRQASALLRNYLLCAAFAAAIIIPVEFGALAEQLTSTRDSIARSGRIRDFGELAVFSSRPWNYLVPSIDHPLLGGIYEDFVRGHLHGSNVFEQTLYIGVVPFALLLAGIGMLAGAKFEAGYRRYFLFFAAGALWMYFLSLPPMIAGVPTLSFFAYGLAPMFRVYARFGILVDFFVACAAAVVLAQLCLRMKRAHFHAMAGTLMAVLLFEYWSIPPSYARPVDDPPAVYRWLAGLPGDVIVAEYPMVRFDEAAFYTYPFWQRIHRKRLVNGAAPDNPRAWSIFEKAHDLSDPETPALLKSIGVEYVIVHKQMYREGPIPGAIKRYYSPARSGLTFNNGKVPPIPAGLKFHKAFGADWVFRLDET